MASEDFQRDLDALDEAFEKRIKRSREAQEADRIAGQARAAEQLPAGQLGQISEAPMEGIDALIEQRRALSAQAQTLGGQDRERALAELQRVDSEFGGLIADRGLDSAATQAERDAGKIAIQQALKSQLRAVRGQANLGNVGPAGLPAGLVNDALGNAVSARTQLELGLITDSRRSVEGLTAARQQARSDLLGQLQRGTTESLAAQSALQSAEQGSMQARSQDILSRQLTNLDFRSRELFGRLAIEDTAVSQGIAERTGIQQQLLAEANASEAARNAQESLEIQRIEAEKPPPSGGKSVVCIAHYMIGNLSKELLDIDLAWAKKTVSEDERSGYYWFGTPMAEKIIENPNCLTARITKRMVQSWCSHVAHMEGHTQYKSDWLGKLMHKVGLPAMSLLGKIRKLWDPGHKIVTDTAQDIHDVYNILTEKENSTDLIVAIMDLQCYDVECKITEVGNEATG